MKSLLRAALPLLSILLLFSTLVNAEGTKEVMPNSTNGVALDVAPGVAAGAYRGAIAQNRIRFYVSDAASENFYFGYRVYDRSATPVEIAIYYRIVNAAGTQVVGPTLLPTTAGSAGRITSYTQAVNGPNIGNLNPTGYTPRLFDPAANGEYYIELYASNDGGATDNGTEFLLVYFDFTVATTANVKFPGRVYCQAWNFITYNTTTFAGDQTKAIDGDFYGYTLDSTVAKIDLNAGFKPFRFTLYLNKTGVANTGVWESDRRSVTTGTSAPALTGGYNVFLNTPDATLFPRSAAPASPVLNKIYGCPGSYFIPYKIGLPGDVAVLLDLNGTAGYQSGTADRYLFAYDVTAGDQVMKWDGLNGLGATVPASTSLNVTVFLRRGRTNLPMYDAELNQNGLTVVGVAPLVSNPKLYWDDAGAGLTNVGTTCDGTTANNNTTGKGVDNGIVGMLSPAHAWDGPGSGLAVPAPTGGGGSATTNLCDDYGNVRTLNTWFWPVEVSSVNNNVALPGCDSDGDGVSNNIDVDDDNDGIADTIESGGTNPQGDADADGIPNYLDPTPGAGAPAFIDTNSDGINDAYDKDGDGVINALDKDSDNDGIPDLAEAGGVDTNGDGTVDYTGTFASNDTDADGLINRYDTAPIANLDADGDGIKNYLDLDSDNDGIPDVVEVGGVDANGDGRLDNFNDTDGDGFDDTVDGDVGNDGTAENTANALLVTGADGTTVDGKPDTYPSGITNTDGRGLPNPYDVDSDDDGIADINEAGGADTNNDGKVDSFADSDGDGFANSVDGDANNDGTVENTAGALLVTGADANNNGKADSYPTADNADASGMPNPYDLDSDDDGIPDLIESSGVDTNGDGRIDTISDADGNGWQNSYDPTQSGILLRGLDANGAPAGGSVFDFDGDGIPNYIDLDSDNDGIPDIIEQEGTDSNNDGKVDATTDADNDGFIDTFDPVNNATGAALGTAIITTGGTLSTQNIPAAYSAGDNLDAKGLINMMDLDADDDGILDTREAGLTDATNDGVADGTQGADGWSDTVDALSSLNLPNTDAQGRANFLDIDSDNDGIPDIIEGQSTSGYAAPANADADADGIDDTYDNNDALFAGGSSNGITPHNQDGADNQDYTDLDSDNDGYSDRIEGWDTNGNKIISGAEIAYVGTTDADGDGLLDEYDANDAAINPTNGTTPISYPNVNKASTTERDWREGNDTDGDGITDNMDIDDDNDGITDVLESSGVNPLGDADGDNIPNYLDPTPGTGPAFTDANGDGISDAYDADKDGIINSSDLDSDNDGIPDLVEAGGIDTNGNGTVDYTGTFASNDSDGDGLINLYDGSNAIENGDTDGDGIKNFLDLDSDNDGIPDVVEAGGVDANGDGRIDGYADSDGDGLDSRVDGDANGDGTVENTAGALVLTGTDGTTIDGKPDTYPQGIANTDGRGKPNAYDLDSDDDGLADITEAGSADTDNNGKVDVFADADGDGFADARDGDVGNDGVSENVSNTLIPTGADTNSDGKADSYAKANGDSDSRPNPYDLDADNDGIPDLIEVGGVDSNGDGLVDAATDANTNGWPDAYEPAQSGINLKTLDANGAAAGGAVFDFDGDGIANYLDLDSDNDGIPDLIEQGGTDGNNDGKVDVTTDIDKDGFADNIDPVNTSTGAALGTALITTGSAVDATTKLPASYSARANFDGKSLINMLDLDSDDDGISDVLEAGFATYDTNSNSIINNSDAGYADANGDGWSDAVDALSSLNLPNGDGDSGKPNYLDLDADNDGIPDNIEARVTASTDAPLNADTDADGLDDRYDAVSGIGGAGLAPVNSDGDATPDYIDGDSDNDGTTDRIEGWDTNGDNRINGSETAYVGTGDADNDGLLDEYDNNDAAFNPTNGTTGLSYPNADMPATPERDWREAADTDGDGIRDNVDLDTDNDGILNTMESGGVNPFGDADGDGVPNYLDPTPGGGPAFTDANNDGVNDNYDADGDGIINAFDLDSDNDGIPDLVEAGGVDTNGDGKADVATDVNNNGLSDLYEGGNTVANKDTDGDGIANAEDLDSDNDGIPDVVEAGATDANNDGRIDGYADANGDGLADAVTGAANALIVGVDSGSDGKADTYTKADFDGDGKPNPYDLDSDGDGILDTRESRLAGDTNNDGVIKTGDTGFTDTNKDGWADAIDALASLNLLNTDGTGKADYLDIDADDDGITDNVEGQATASYQAPGYVDADGDGIDDVYENGSTVGTFGGNGITPEDTDTDALPDYRDLDSDNDSDADKIEGNDLNLNKKADDVPGTIPTTDTDGDGLLDFWESNINSGPVVTIAGFGGTGFSGKSTAQKTLSSATERDWRNSAFSLTTYVSLPVKFLSVTAVAKAVAIEVAWTVEKERNVLYYAVERSTDGVRFTQVGTVAYKATGASVNSYTFADSTASGQHVFYRVRQVDEDGRATLSAVVSVRAATSVTKLAIYPNPVQPGALVQLTATAAQHVTLLVVDMQGRIVLQQVVTVQKGQNRMLAPALQALPAGTYILTATIDGKRQQAPFVKY